MANPLIRTSQRGYFTLAPLRRSGTKEKRLRAVEIRLSNERIDLDVSIKTGKHTGIKCTTGDRIFLINFLGVGKKVKKHHQLASLIRSPTTFSHRKFWVEGSYSCPLPPAGGWERVPGRRVRENNGMNKTLLKKEKILFPH